MAITIPPSTFTSTVEKQPFTSDSDNTDSEGVSTHTSKQRRGSIDAPDNAKRYVKAHKQAFLSDEEISSHWVFRLIAFLLWNFNQFFHRLTFPNYYEKCDPNRAYLMIHMHTTHNADIGLGIVATQKFFHRVVRGLVHRNVMLFNPWLAYIGMVPGYRDTAVQLLSQGFWVGVIPGGGEEAMRGHENAYNLDWPSKRRGFAKVAIKAGVPILPVFYQNCEEMRFNPFLWLWNKTYYGSRIYDYIVAKRIPVISAAVKLLGEMIWFLIATFFSIPMPSKVTAYVGDPIEVSDDSDVDEIRTKAYEGLKSLIKEYQPNGVDRWRAFQMWWEDRRLEKTIQQKNKEL